MKKLIFLTIFLLSLVSCSAPVVTGTYSCVCLDDVNCINDSTKLTFYTDKLERVEGMETFVHQGKLENDTFYDYTYDQTWYMRKDGVFVFIDENLIYYYKNCNYAN